jgi:hypothetical protein
MSRISQGLAATEYLYLIREGNGKNLQELYGDGLIITIAAAVIEEIEIWLVEKQNDFEWTYCAKAESDVDKLSVHENLRVLGYTLFISRIVPCI